MKKSLIFLLLTAVLLAGCAAAPEEPEQTTRSLSEILSDYAQDMPQASDPG